jgi:hypothetical protein
VAVVLGLIFLAGTLTLTLPWHARNLLSTGTASLAGRAGVVLTARANYDALPVPDLMAAAAMFSPNGSLLDRHLSERWLTPEAEARLTWPDDPIGRAFVRQEELRQQTGLATFRPELDAMLRREAMARIGELWPQHLRATLLFGYRGLFAERGLGFVRWPAGITTLGGELLGVDAAGWMLSLQTKVSLLLFLPAFAAFTFCALTRRWPLVFLMLPAAYLYGLQALMTHYIPRYSAPLIPMLIVIAMLTLAAICGRLSAWASR